MTGLQLNNATLDLKQDENGRLQLGRVDEQNQYLLLKIQKGGIKQYPTRGVGIDNYIEADNYSAMFREVKKQYTADGMNVSSVALDGDDLLIDATY